MHLVPPNDPILWTPAAPVTDIATQVLPYLEEMRALMAAHDGVGLAAPQVGISLRFFITLGGYLVVNPVITERARGYQFTEEGCLSLPGFRARVRRYSGIRLTFTDEQGVEQRATLDGLGAVIAQHECDHLDGRLIFERPQPPAAQIPASLAQTAPDSGVTTCDSP